MNSDPLNALKSNTELLAAEIARTKVGFGEWCTNFFSSSSVIDQKNQKMIMLAAERHIQEQSDVAVGAIQGVFLRGKRRLYLASRERIAEQIRRDLHAYLQSKQKESADRAGRFSRLSQMLKEKNDPLQLTDQARQKLLDSLKRVGERSEENSKRRNLKDKEIPKEWQSARETEQMLKQQLLQLNILGPANIEDYLDRNARGDTELQDLVKNNSELRNKKELRTCLINALKELRRGNTRFYRLQKLMERDPNTGTVQERLNNLQKDNNILGRRMQLALPGVAPLDTFVAHRGDGFLTLKDAYSQKYYIFDLQTGEVTYRDTSRVFHDYPLTESSFSLN